MKSKGVVLFTLALALIAFLGYVVVAGLPWFGGKYVLGVANPKAIRYGLDLSGGVTITYMPENGIVPTQGQMDTVKSIMTKRLQAQNYFDANVTTSSTNRVIVEIPNLTDPQAAVEKLGKTALLEFIELPGAAPETGIIPEGYGTVILTGTDMKEAKAQLNGNKWIVNFNITPEAQKKFAEATARLAPTNGIIAITLDRAIISAPHVDEKIDSDSAYIEGGFDEFGAKELADLIKSGALPFKLKPVTTQYVGATLGQNALDISVKAGLIGFLLVALFMMFWYRVPGVAAVLALLAYIGTVLFIFARSKITLTLPGIAGIILSIGVAVDANVIIFERLKEELRSGKSLRAAIDAGFSRAWPAIRDANVTTLISSLVLFFLGTGPIKGFALTLIIGIIVSMLSAILLTRFLMNQLYNMGVINTRLYGFKEEKA